MSISFQKKKDGGLQVVYFRAGPPRDSAEKHRFIEKTERHAPLFFEAQSFFPILLHFVKKQSLHSRNPCAVKPQSGINGSATPAVLWTDFIPFAA